MKTVYRVINALMGLGVLVASFFANFVKITIGTSKNLDEFFSNLTDGGSTGVALAETFSVKRFINFFNGKDDLSVVLDIKKSAVFLWPEDMDKLKTRLIVFAVATVLILITAIFIIVFSCISGRRIPMLVAGIAGVILTIVFIRVFNSMSYAILSGDVNLVDYFADTLFGEGLLLKIVGSLASDALVIYLTLAGVHIWFFALFLGVAIWTAVFYLVELGDPDAKKQREEEEKARQAKKAAKKAKKKDKAEAKA